MDRSYLRHLRRNSIISVFLVLMGLYALHITPAFPGPNSVEPPSILSRVLVIASVFLFAGACFIEVAALTRLFAPWVLRHSSPERIQDFTLVVFGIAGVAATIYATIYVIMPIRLVWPWLVAIIAAGSTALAVAQWASIQIQKPSFN